MHEPTTHSPKNLQSKDTKKIGLSLSDLIDNEMNSIALVGVTLDPKLELELSEIKATDTIEPPIIALKIGEGIVSTLGNILTFIGKAKSRKSFLITIAIAIAVSEDYVFGLFTSHLPNDKRTILLFDTEQSKYHVQKALLRVCDMIGIKEPQNLKVYGLRKYPPNERLQIIEYAVYNTPNIGLVFIDGIKDLITSINDEEQATMIVSKLMKWTEELNISVCTVLHQNKSDTNARGHIGTELQNKSETVISVTKSEQDKDISIVEPVACRNIDFEPFGFEINEDGIPILAENMEVRTATKKDKFDPTELEDHKKYQLLTEVFSHEKEIKYGALKNQLKLAYKKQFKKEIGFSAIETLIVDFKNNNWILQEAKLKPYTLGSFDEDEVDEF